MTPCEWLRAALASGPLDSREIKQLADAQGITPKSLRTARERLGIRVSRSGVRAAMRSTWALAEQSDGAPRRTARPSVERPGEVPTAHPHEQVLRDRSARMHAREEARQPASQAHPAVEPVVLTFTPGRPPKSVDIDSLNEPSLRNYAAAIGVSKRDVEGLTVERLRQNCKLHLAHWFEMLSEG